jgi:hypothetical protein
MEKTELLFAHWAVRKIGDARGPKWKKLTQEIAKLPETHLDALALALTMMRVNSCVTCDAKKYVERGGCGRCSVSMLALSKDDEDQLIERFRAARKEVAKTLKEKMPAERAA